MDVEIWDIDVEECARLDGCHDQRRRGVQTQWSTGVPKTYEVDVLQLPVESISAVIGFHAPAPCIYINEHLVLSEHRRMSVDFGK